MHDLTRGGIAGHITRLSVPIAIGMLFQTLYHLIDLYFVGRLGDAAIAGVAAAGNLQLVVVAGTQILGIGAMALIANASGRGDPEDATLLYNQGLSLSAVCALGTLVLGYAAAAPYLSLVAADDATRKAGVEYLLTFVPGLALQFPLVAMGSALRGAGIARPAMVIQLLTVLLNAVLAPTLIAGWGTGVPLGVAGAGLATTLSIAFGLVLMSVFMSRLDPRLQIRRATLRPRRREWRRIFAIGLPPGGEFALMFIYMMLIFWILARFNANAQAGFGIGQRVMQAIFLPAMAIAFGAAPVAAQNVGAGFLPRVRETFRVGGVMICLVMMALTALCLLQPALLVAPFTDDPGVREIAAGFLAIICWNFLPSGLIFLCSGMFQALGNTLPALLSSATRLITFAIPALWLSGLDGFTLQHLWWLSVATVALQAAVSLLLAQRAFRRHGINLLGKRQPTV